MNWFQNKKSSIVNGLNNNENICEEYLTIFKEITMKLNKHIISPQLTTKKFKIRWLKSPKTVLKNKSWTRKYMIKNIVFGVYVRMSLFHIFWQKVSKLTKTSKKDSSSYNTISIKKPHTFYERRLSQTYKKYTPATQPNYVSGWCQKKHLHSTIPKRPRTAFLEHLESKCLYIPVNLRSKFLFQRRRKLLLGAGAE